jgi:hypothetical protein
MTRIYIDTETGPSRRMDVHAWLAAKHFDKADIEKSAKKAADALAKTSLSATLCELHVVGIAIDEGEPHCYVQDENGEAGLIRTVAELLSDIIDKASSSPLEIWAFNESFDRAVLRVAAMRHGIKLPRAVHAVGVKLWDSPWRCAMEPLKIEWKDFVSLTQACLAFGIPLGFDAAGDIPGSEVGAAIARGEIERVAHHCAMDVRRLREVARRIRATTED